MGFVSIGTSQITAFHRPTKHQIEELKQHHGITMIITL